MKRKQIYLLILVPGSLIICLGLTSIVAAILIANLSDRLLPTTYFSTQVRDELINAHSRIQARPTRNVHLIVTGNGKIQPDEIAQGIQELVCYRMTLEYYTPAREDYNWTLVTESLIAKRKGNSWIGGSSAVTNDAWAEHSCPGRYQYSSVDIPNDPYRKYLLLR